MKEKENKPHSIAKWAVEMFILTFVLSIVFSFISANGVSNLQLIPAIFILALVIFIGIFTDMIGVAVTVANEHEFHAKATKKVEGSKTSLKLIKNASKVANICADVISDICGVLSGSIAALISLKITQGFNLNFDVQFIMSALVAALTVSGKAIGKDLANRKSTPIVHAAGTVMNKLTPKDENKNMHH